MELIEPHVGDGLSLHQPPAVQKGSEPRNRACTHAVQFYEDDAFLVTIVADFIATGVAAGQPVIVFATAEHASNMRPILRRRGLDMDSLVASEQLVLGDVEAAIATILVDGLPDATRFRSMAGGLVKRALDESDGRGVRVFGEIVDVLWKRGNSTAALQLEELWNQLQREYNFTLVCGYQMGRFADVENVSSLHAVCAPHTTVSPTEQFLQFDDTGRGVEIALLQQRARALSTEIVRRESLEAELERTVGALRQREAELADVLENAAEGIHSVRADGTIKWANRTELEMLGYSAEEYVGHHISEFHVDADVIDDMLKRLSCGESLNGYEARLRCKNGSIRDVLVSSNVLWQDGEFVYTRCFTRDVTELKRVHREREKLLESERRARAEAERARAVAEQANRARSQFLAVMSHELRTPLNAIGGYAELLDMGIQGPVTVDQREALDRILRSQRHLLGLINQVLNYTRLETGSLRYEVSDVSVAEVLHTAEALTLPQIQAKGLRYTAAADMNGLCVRADREKFQQIILNLLANAIKFTDSGGSVFVATDDSGDRVKISIADTGIGIAAEKCEAIFDPFVQVDTNYTRSRDGIGLGLAISRDLARAMSGDLTVVSQLGGGSTFTLELPKSHE